MRTREPEEDELSEIDSTPPVKTRRRKRRSPARSAEKGRAPRTGAKRTLLGTMAELPSYLRLLVGLMTDGAVSRLDRLLVVAALAYIISPLDFVPDVIPFFGQVDDIFMLIASLQRLVRRAGRRTLLQHWSGDPAALSDAALARVVGAAAFFLPGRITQKLGRLVRRR